MKKLILLAFVALGVACSKQETETFETNTKLDLILEGDGNDFLLEEFENWQRTGEINLPGADKSNQTVDELFASPHPYYQNLATHRETFEEQMGVRVNGYWAFRAYWAVEQAAFLLPYVNGEQEDPSGRRTPLDFNRIRLFRLAAAQWAQDVSNAYLREAIDNQNAQGIRIESTEETEGVDVNGDGDFLDSIYHLSTEGIWYVSADICPDDPIFFRLDNWYELGWRGCGGREFIGSGGPPFFFNSDTPYGYVEAYVSLLAGDMYVFFDRDENIVGYYTPYNNSDFVFIAPGVNIHEFIYYGGRRFFSVPFFSSENQVLYEFPTQADLTDFLAHYVFTGVLPDDSLIIDVPPLPNE